MNHKLLILEDDTNQRKALTKLISEHYNNIIVESYQDTVNAQKKIESIDDYTLFLLDISINSTSVNREGINLATYIRGRKCYSQTPIIFITAYPRFVFDAINDTHCYSYIIKPYTNENVISQVDDIIKVKDTITLRTIDRYSVTIRFTDIYYIESIGRYIHFHTANNGDVTSRQYRLSELLDILPDCFIRCHKSYIINSNYVSTISSKNKSIVLNDISEDIPYTDKYKPNL
ncbi:MAG: LytTR family DNA-binding domain-containing protein [Lachnospiraceae bacterium]|nr:LytTR family DNA-binding domain-containing protein [Lachnospiraceae bacterium]